MNEEILKLAKECGMNTHGFPAPHWLEAFYRAAYNKAIADAAKLCGETTNEAFMTTLWGLENSIRRLGMK